jgi:hypothetical protein
MGGPFFFSSPALVAMCQAELGNREAASGAREEALALDPTFAKDPHGAYRLHRVPESLIDQFMDGLHKAGLEDPAGQAAAAANWVAGTRARSEQLGREILVAARRSPTWPDRLRQRATEHDVTGHDVNPPRHDEGFDEDSCRWRTNASHQHQEGSCRAGVLERERAGTARGLKCLGHWVGDVHADRSLARRGPITPRSAPAYVRQERGRADLLAYEDGISSTRRISTSGGDRSISLKARIQSPVSLPGPPR